MNEENKCLHTFNQIEYLNMPNFLSVFESVLETGSTHLRSHTMAARSINIWVDNITGLAIVTKYICSLGNPQELFTVKFWSSSNYYISNIWRRLWPHLLFVSISSENSKLSVAKGGCSIIGSLKNLMFAKTQLWKHTPNKQRGLRKKSQ